MAASFGQMWMPEGVPDTAQREPLNCCCCPDPAIDPEGARRYIEASIHLMEAEDRDAGNEAGDSETAALRARLAEADQLYRDCLDCLKTSAADNGLLFTETRALKSRIRTLEAEVPPGYAKLPSGEVVPVLGWFWRTKDGAIVARTDERVYVCEGLDGYTRWSGKVVPTLFCNWLNKSDSGWQGNPTASMKFAAPDGGWHCWSTREACEAAIAARAATSPIGGVA